ncbi:glycosyltransferase family 4 protein [Paenarthrobacter nitroguajacolicus]|uniref:glycosyltransferase family 4 protein n=2 Tax=Paenarthrobacter nitroguajacolicus TaxID=211146 RepID=UPI003436BD7F
MPHHIECDLRARRRPRHDARRNGYWGAMAASTEHDCVRILHVTEASGGGVLQVASQLARHQSADGALVTVAMTERIDTPSDEDLRAGLGAGNLVRLNGGSTLNNVGAIFRYVRAELRHGVFDVIHLHSAFAGLAGRLARMTVLRTSATIVYSPHAFAFLRQDLAAPIRIMVRTIESLLTWASDGIIAVSGSEAVFARKLRRGGKVVVLSNCLELERLPRNNPATSSKPQVVNLGRLVPQKGPERFLHAAKGLADQANFVWIGGTTGNDAPLEIDSYVHVTGQLPHGSATARLQSATVHLFTSKWEGMPLALMESQAMGIPAIAWDCEGVSDIVIDGKTGFVVRDETQMMERLSSVLSDPDLRARLSRDASIMRERFSSTDYGRRSLEAYGRLGNDRCRESIQVSGPEKGNLN